MQALYYLKEYDRVISLGYVIYSHFNADIKFRQELITALEEKGHYEEAEVEKISYFSKKLWNQYDSGQEAEIVKVPQCFIIAGQRQEFVYTNNSDEMQLAEILAHMGNKVILIFDDEGKTSNAYLDACEGRKFKDASGVQRCYLSYKKENVKKTGIDHILKKYFGDTEKIFGLIKGKEDWDLLEGTQRIYYDLSEVLDDTLKICGKKEMDVRIGWDKLHRMNPVCIKYAMHLMRYIKERYN